MLVQPRLSKPAERRPTGPAILETYWWPRHAVACAAHARHKQDEWIEELRGAGVKPGDVLDFYAEDVVGRFRLIVNRDESYRTEDIVAPLGTIGSYFYVTNEGDTADTIYTLASQVHSANRGPFPVECQVRVSMVKDPIKMRMEFVDDCVLRFVPM